MTALGRWLVTARRLRAKPLHRAHVCVRTDAWSSPCWRLIAQVGSTNCGEHSVSCCRHQRGHRAFISWSHAQFIRREAHRACLQRAFRRRREGNDSTRLTESGMTIGHPTPGSLSRNRNRCSADHTRRHTLVVRLMVGVRCARCQKQRSNTSYESLSH